MEFRLAPCGMDCYDYGVEIFMNYIRYPYLYHSGLFRSRCAANINCDRNCSRCPSENLRQLHHRVSIK